MEPTTREADDAVFLKRVTTATIHVGLLLLLTTWCLFVVRPLIVPVLWAMVMAVALAPLHSRLRAALGGRSKLAASLVTLAALALLLVPSALFFGSLAEGVYELASGLRDGTLEIPPPPESVADWPVVGEQLVDEWSKFTENAAVAAQQFAPQFEAVASKLMAFVAGVAGGTLGFAFSIVVAGVFLAIGVKGATAVEALAVRLLGDRGRAVVATSVATIRSVAQGVLGVAVIQALLVGIGLLVAGVPGAGLWALLVMVLAIVQLPPLLITAPIIAYVFTRESTTVAVLFAVWTVIASASDTFLKPLFLGRGMEIPMLVILVGAIGGMLAAGMLGLFLGACVLAIGYDLFMVWLKEGDARQPADAAGETPAAP